MGEAIMLRPVEDEDLTIFFEQQREPEGVYMAAFTTKNPDDRAAFDRHWARIRATESIIIRTILHADAIAGHILSFVQDGRREISYWLGRDFWGKGIATEALRQYVAEIGERPLYARVAADNAASRRVLEKCGFVMVGYGRGFANARGMVIEEFLMRLAGEESGAEDGEQESE